MIEFSNKGKNFDKTLEYLAHIKKPIKRDILEKYGQRGVEALSEATPFDTGETASSWYYQITETNSGLTIGWYNSNVQNDWANIALLLQYGHGTRNGGWVEGRDYINPALRPIFDKMAKEAWEEVTKYR